eukprot:1189023-Prorocentrum_minimum.AAC.1
MDWRTRWLCVGVLLACGAAAKPPLYLPCYPHPVIDTIDLNGTFVQVAEGPLVRRGCGDGRTVNFTECGDEGVGNQSIWWRAIEAHDQCFGLSQPERHCSKSTTQTFQCLVGEEWDETRRSLHYPAQTRKKVAKIEVGGSDPRVFARYSHLHACTLTHRNTELVLPLAGHPQVNVGHSSAGGQLVFRFISGRCRAHRAGRVDELPGEKSLQTGSTQITSKKVSRSC